MKIKLLAGVLIWFSVFGNAVFAQKENYVWYFGNHAGVDFNSGTPVALTNGMLYTGEGCSSISDAIGNLLFYTDGTTVYDRNHNQMPNGDSLAGGFSSTQSALIIPFPGNSLLFYIFTVQDVSSATHNFSYSIVNISLNSGNGDVTTKNGLLLATVSEKLTAVKHSNNMDVWVMAHSDLTTTFYAYLITSSGIQSPILSAVGTYSNLLDGVGQMKFSPGGTLIAYASWGTNFVDLFDFNIATGNVTNEKFLTVPPGITYGAYGLEFSPGGSYLYCSGFQTHTLYQWEITSNSAAVINSTRQLIDSAAASYGQLQLGPDGKIYVVGSNINYLNVINDPDSPGVSCNYVANAIQLMPGHNCRSGLPNFITSYFLQTGIHTNNPPQNQLTISPNPATDKITISFPSTTSENITIKFFSVTGAVVFAEENKTATNYFTKTIDVKDFSNGIYFLSVQTGREVITRKIIVNH